MFKCPPCNYETNRKSNYDRHLVSKKHLQNHKNVNSTVGKNICHICFRQFKRYSHLKRHLDRKNKCQPPAISKTETTTVTETHNIKFFLPEWITIDEFIQNLQTSHQLTEMETQSLLESFSEQNLFSYSSCLSKTLKENCYRQLLDKKEIANSRNIHQTALIPDVRPTTINLTSLAYQDRNPEAKIIQIMTISNDQVYDHHRQVIEMKIEHQHEVVEYFTSQDQMLITDRHSPQHSHTNLTNITNLTLEKAGLSLVKLNELPTYRMPHLSFNRKKMSLSKHQTPQKLTSTSPPTSYLHQDPVFKKDDTYQKILDCGTNYLVNKEKFVFQAEEPNSFVGNYIHDENCPCHENDNITNCWYWVQYAHEKNTLSLEI